MNMVDASGLCSKVVSSGSGQKTENYYDAIECRSLRDELRTWGVNVVWDELRAIDPYSPENCGQPEAVQRALSQNVKQRFTLSEMEAIYNAFRVFGAARSRIGFMHYPWPLANKSVTVEKRPTVQDNALGIHNYSDRRITMSAVQWGEFSSLHRPKITDNAVIIYVPIGRAYRSWLVLHEFSHIFVKDQDSNDPDGYGTSRFPKNMRDAGFTPDTGLVTAYAFVSDYEAATEAVTGTLWNNGYTAVQAFDESGGGRTGHFDAVGLDRYTVNRTVNNVRTIRNNAGQTLEEWVIAELGLRSN